VAKSRQQQLHPWLRPLAAEECLRLDAQDRLSEPLRWDRYLMWLARRRGALMAAENFRLLAAEHDLKLLYPLLQPSFLAVLGRKWGPWGFTDRTAAMRAVFGDLLPAAVVERKTKAVFNRAFAGASTRDFALSWDGSGVDPAFVDPGRLRQEWLSDRPSALSTCLLQAAWLHNQRPTVT
jgi:asparagine synthase (glutamine-hydrolysing)